MITTQTTWDMPAAYSGTYELEFSDPSFAGLVVTMGRHTAAAIDTAIAIRDIDVQAAQRGELDVAEWGKLTAGIAEFSQALVSWNLTQDGVPVGTDYATIRNLDLVFVLQIYMIWVRALIGITWEGVDEGDLSMEVSPGGE